MDNPGLNLQLKRLLICAIGLIVAAFLGTQIGSENYGELFLGAVIAGLIGISLFSGRFFWVLTVASSFLGGTFPILRGQFTPFQILMAIGVLKFFLGDVVLRRTKLKIGAGFDVLLIFGFISILTWHGVHDRFGMRFLGSNVWGGRSYVNVYVGLIAFFVIQSIPMTASAWKRLPYVILAVISFDLSIAIITTVYPQSIFKIYPFYSAVSSVGVGEILTGTPEGTGRIGAFGTFGFVLVLLVLASLSMRQFFHPANFFRLIAAGLGFVAVLLSGFRSTVTNTLVAGLLAGIRDLKWAVLLVLPIVGAILFSLSVINSEFVPLPRQIQRGLTFIPGNWDVDMATSAEASNEYRTQIWGVFTHEYFPRHPWLGRGFGFRSQYAERSVKHYNPNWDRETVETGNIHNGFLSMLDTLGILGGIFFLIWNVRLLARTFRVRLRPHSHPAAMVLRFLALYLATSIVSYWYGALNLGSFLPQEFAVAGVFVRLQQLVELELAEPSAAEGSTLAAEHDLAPALS